MKKNIFIEVFNEIGVSAFGMTNIEAKYEAQNTAMVICSSLDAMNELGGCCDSRTAYLMKMITDKFDKNDSVGKEVHEFISDINVMVIASNRYWLDFGRLSTAINQLQNK